ncbi:MAG: type II secretion system protein [Cyanobacteria bacterium SIG29]|nr:type II secretion system protein [Cyanobacteria bacterium SIG29]
MKKAFTLSEALVTLAILGVLAAILIPVLDNVRPDKDKITYKKALYSLQGAVSNAMDSTEYAMANNSAAFWKDTAFQEGGYVGAHAFCQAVASSLNTAGKVNCQTSGYDNCKNSSASCYDSPNFVTTDGIRFWGLEGYNWNEDGTGGNARVVYVDRAIGTSELKAVQRTREKTGDDVYGMKIRIWHDGKVDTGDSAKYDFENELIENSLQVTQNKY